MTTTLNHTQTVTELPTTMLERFRSRAGELDRKSDYFEEDLAELRSIGYLAAAVPADRGGWGLDLAQLAVSQRRLARYAPATALSMTMHSYWITGSASSTRSSEPATRRCAGSTTPHWTAR